jgi:RHS repeat-associated protein
VSDLPKDPRYIPKNAAGKIIKAIDPVGREAVHVYGTGSTPDANQATGAGIDLLQMKQKNPGSPGGWDVLQSATYNINHQPLTSTDTAGQVTTNTYLADGRLQTMVTPARIGPTGTPLTLAERTTTYSYYSDTDPPSRRTRLQTITGPFTIQGSPSTTYGYDGYGRVQTTTDEEGYALSYEYDVLDRPRKTTYPDGTFEETGYNRLDSERQRDRLGRWSHTFHDALRRAISTRDPEGRTTTYEWCICGSMDKLIDANGHPTAWERDMQGRITRELRADNAAWEYTYETSTSRLKRRKDPKNQLTTYIYTPDNNLTSIAYTGEVIATTDVSFTYDPNFNRLATLVDSTGTTVYGYYTIAAPSSLGAGQLASIDGPLASDTITYTYDELGRRTTRQINGSANTMTTTYDALSRVVRKTNLLGVFTFDYQAATGRLANVAYPNGQTSTYAYLNHAGDHRLQDIHHQRSGGATLSRHTYTTSPMGQILTWQQQVDIAAPNVHEYNYDRVDQLISAVQKATSGPPTVLKTYSYAYDPAGNRTTESIDTTVLQPTYDNRNRLLQRQAGGSLRFAGTLNEPAAVTVAGQPAPVTGDDRFAGSAPVASGTQTVPVVATDPAGNVRSQVYQMSVTGGADIFTHDANGNLTGDGVRTYEWDAENRLIRVLINGNEVSRFVYDANGRRRQKIVGSTTSSYVMEGDHVAEERLSSGSIGTIRYFHGPGTDDWLGRQEIDGSATHFVADHLGSVITHTNSTGQPTLTRTYDPWGTLDPATSATSGLAFTGREWDAESSLYYYRARYYDPRLGRFISEDPISLQGGMNLYRYVSNKPTTRRDPLGLADCCPEDQCPSGIWYGGGATGSAGWGLFGGPTGSASLVSVTCWGKPTLSASVAYVCGGGQRRVQKITATTGLKDGISIGISADAVVCLAPCRQDLAGASVGGTVTIKAAVGISGSFTQGTSKCWTLGPAIGAGWSLTGIACEGGEMP